MELTNIRSHRIRWSALLARGALVGLVSAAVMLVLACLLYPLLADGESVWTFPNVVSSSVLGDDAASPLGTFEATPVLVGLLLHFAIGAIAGATYAFLIAMFDLEGWTPVALFGLLYGAMLFVWSAALVGAGFGGAAIQDLPLIVMFWGNLVFGLTAGMLLATWADRADLDQVESERVARFEDGRDRARDPARGRRVVH